MSLLLPLDKNGTWEVVILETEDSLATMSDLGVVALGLFHSAFLLALITALHKFPGHDGGSLWPVWVPEHYSLQTSQNPLDPYSISHVTHGALGYIIVFLTGQ